MNGTMRALKAHVRGGRLLLDEPTGLPDGTEVRVALAAGHPVKLEIAPRAAEDRCCKSSDPGWGDPPCPWFGPVFSSRYLTDDEAVAEYMNAVLESGDSNLLLRALGEVARDTGLGRESLYKALAPGAKPRFDTVLRVVGALGLKLTARVA